MTSIVLNPLFEKLKINPIKLYFEIDCNFPNHSPDISKPEALNALKQKLSETKADLGIAFDGDGDRVFFVDEKGNIIKAEYILALLYEDKKGLFHNPKVVYDLRISKSVKEHLGSRGKKTRPGHSFIKFLMQENDADLGGELSGHFFFKEMEYAESSILAMLQVLKIISEKGKHITKLVESYQKYWHSGEINLEIRDMRQATLIFEKLKDKYKDGEIDETDGILIDYWNIKSAGQRWWFNIRASNTEPLLRLVVEAETKELMEKKVRELKSLISEID